MKTILLADDEANLRMLVRTTLEDPQYRILEAVDGAEALALARAERPDLLVLDWMMPGVSGIEVARALRQDPVTTSLPIIMLTAKGQETDKEQGRVLGTYAYLVKPFSPLELLEKVQEVLTTSTSTIDTAEPTTEVQRQLDLADSQLALYVRDLKRTVEAERQKARELAAANARLQLLDRLKTDFLSFISHELRTPLHRMSALDLLDPHGDTREQAELISFVRKGYAYLEGFVQKGLEYFQWLAAERPGGAEVTDLAAVVRRVADRLVRPAKTRVDCQISVPGDSCLVRGQEKHLAEVVQILLDNALKFSGEEKFIQAVVHATGEAVTLTVADRGQGFAPELAQELFRPFTISDVLHHSCGTGLSLALARAIVTAHGGHIRADSEGNGKGATFTVEFPPASPSPATSGEDGRPSSPRPTPRGSS